MAWLDCLPEKNTNLLELAFLEGMCEPVAMCVYSGDEPWWRGPMKPPWLQSMSSHCRSFPIDQATLFPISTPKQVSW